MSLEENTVISKSVNGEFRKIRALETGRVKIKFHNFPAVQPEGSDSTNPP